MTKTKGGVTQLRTCAGSKPPRAEGLFTETWQRRKRQK